MRFSWGTQVYEGEAIETKVRRLMETGEPIKDGAPLVYQERKEGVKPEFDIRSDKWEIAEGAMNMVAKAETAKGNKTPLTGETGSVTSGSEKTEGESTPSASTTE
ncbi:hypothetical protein [Microvirus sp.]|nr:hypothetical protein [Microvirus sp.]